MKEKLTSRKFWSAMISIITGILLIFGVEESVASLISGAALILVPAIVYIFTEGKVDAAALQQIDVDALLEKFKEYLNAEKTQKQDEPPKAA